jgi:hypothetical protein
MTNTVATGDAELSAISWAAVVAGGIANAALTLILLAFGGGMGLSSVSPWPGAGISSGTFQIATGIYLVVAAMLSSTIGGYVAGRLRTRWTGVHSEEVLFRDTAHGFLAWCLAAVLGSALLGASATYLVSGAAQPRSASAPTASSATNGGTGEVGYFTDMLLRPAPNATAAPALPAPLAPNATDAARASAGLVIAHALTSREDISPADRTYLAQLVTARTGLPQADAERRVTDTMQQAKAAADAARKAAAALALWLTVAMLAGAFSASLAAIEGGQLRDGRWKGVIGAKRYEAAQAG